jgi:hypothetical protein
MMDQPTPQGRIEIAHRLSIKIDDPAGFERPDVVYFDDDLLAGTLDTKLVLELARRTYFLLSYRLVRHGEQDAHTINIRSSFTGRHCRHTGRNSQCGGGQTSLHETAAGFLRIPSKSGGVRHNLLLRMQPEYARLLAANMLGGSLVSGTTLSETLLHTALRVNFGSYQRSLRPRRLWFDSEQHARLSAPGRPPAKP